MDMQTFFSKLATTLWIYHPPGITSNNTWFAVYLFKEFWWAWSNFPTQAIEKFSRRMKLLINWRAAWRIFHSWKIDPQQPALQLPAKMWSSHRRQRWVGHCFQTLQTTLFTSFEMKFCLNNHRYSANHRLRPLLYLRCAQHLSRNGLKFCLSFYDEEWYWSRKIHWGVHTKNIIEKLPSLTQFLESRKPSSMIKFIRSDRFAKRRLQRSASMLLLSNIVEWKGDWIKSGSPEERMLASQSRRKKISKPTFQAFWFQKW